MTPDRHDAVLILARGESRRMGGPKGLCRLAADGPTLLETVASLYTDRPLTVATLPTLVDGYRSALAERPDAVWLALEPGDDTARTVLASWAAGLGRFTHLWLHPVDLPLVSADTIGALARASAADPAAVVRPAHGGAPGHPVVVPTALLDWAASRRSEFRGAPMRDVVSAWAVAGGGRIVAVPLDDAGCITDFDDPAALARHRKDPAT